jgi:hypothetical protein
VACAFDGIEIIVIKNEAIMKRAITLVAYLPVLVVLKIIIPPIDIIYKYTLNFFRRIINNPVNYYILK